MEAFEFKTKIKDGVIQIPRKYTQKAGTTVKVIVLTDQESKHFDMVGELLEHPVKPWRKILLNRCILPPLTICKTL